ncbi:MAG: DUF262 domain-containing protein [Spirochaetia bacterium]|nr:DUF262 domain-containing protein [Spirochaetia bacterium]
MTEKIMDTKVYYGEYSLKHWVDLLLAQQITLPEYQRSFVWTKKDVCLFVQSLKRNEFVPPVTIGAFFDEDGNEVNYVIDGQQRLTSILLAYLGYYPNVDKFINTDAGVHTSVDEIDEEENEDKDIVLKWTFKTLINKKFNNKSEVVDKIKSQEDNYDIIDETLNNDLDKIFLGFSYIVPLDKKEQVKYYSSVFRHMNISGVKLLPQETRESLYFLDKEKLPFFKNDVFNQCTIKNLRVDFVRYAAFASQYFLRNGSTGIMRNYARKEEEYYEDYIYSIINPESEAAKKEIFATFDESFTNNFKNRFVKLQKILKELKLEQKFPSIVDADLNLFGVFYFVLIMNKDFKVDEVEIKSLHEKINNEIEIIKSDILVYKNPSLLKNLRPRLDKSIEIFQAYLK